MKVKIGIAYLGLYFEVEGTYTMALSPHKHEGASINPPEKGEFEAITISSYGVNMLPTLESLYVKTQNGEFKNAVNAIEQKCFDTLESS